MLFFEGCQQFDGHLFDNTKQSFAPRYVFLLVRIYFRVRRRYAKRASNAENIYVVGTIVLCFLVTIGFAFAFSGKSFLEIAGVLAKSEERSFFVIAVGGYEDMALARSTAEFSKNRGGAGYVLKEKNENKDDIFVLLSIYADKSSAEKVLAGLEDNSATLKEIAVKQSDFGWADKSVKDEVKKAVNHFDIAFETLFATSNSLENDEITLEGAKTQIKVLYEQIKDIKSIFYEKTRGFDNAKLTEVKLFLTTILALIDNIDFASKVKAVSTMRYQLIQMTYCFQALQNTLSK